MKRLPLFLCAAVVAGFAPSDAGAQFVYTVRANPYADLIRAQAELTRAAGEYRLMEQQAIEHKEKNRLLRFEVERKEYEQYDWKRDQHHKWLEDERERAVKATLRRSRNNPTMNEIWSGFALNSLLEEMKKHTASSAGGASTPLNPECLDHINFHMGKGGNVGILKEGRLKWPYLFLRPELEKEVKKFEELVKANREHTIKYGEISPKLVDELERQLGQMERRRRSLFEAAKAADFYSLDGNTFMVAGRFLSDLTDAVKMLKAPEAAYYFKLVQAKTVAELLEHMKGNGLFFAKATAGSERFYTVLHQAMVDELNRIDGGPRQ